MYGNHDRYKQYSRHYDDLFHLKDVELEIFGKPGGYITKHFDFFLKKVLEKKFANLILSLAGNDLTEIDFSSEETMMAGIKYIVQRLNDFADKVHSEHNVKHIVWICQLYRNVDTARPRLHPNYNSAVDMLNSMMQTSFKDKHKKAFQLEHFSNGKVESITKRLLSDGTHLNDVAYKPFYNDIICAIKFSKMTTRYSL